MDDEAMVIIDGSTGEVERLPPAKTQRYRAKLDTVQDVRRELAKLYRETRSGLIDPADATKLGWLLGEVRKTVELENKANDPQSEGGTRPMTLADFYGQESITTKDPIQAAKDYQQLMR